LPPLTHGGFKLAAQPKDLVRKTQRDTPIVGEFELATALAEQAAPQAVFQQLDLA
jgi:hypothetical protein